MIPKWFMSMPPKMFKNTSENSKNPDLEKKVRKIESMHKMIFIEGKFVFG